MTVSRIQNIVIDSSQSRSSPVYLTLTLSSSHLDKSKKDRQTLGKLYNVFKAKEGVSIGDNV